MLIRILATILRGSLGFGLLLLFTRAIGNKQLGQLNIFTYISGIAVGAMAGGMAIYHDIEVMESVVGIVLWGVLTVVLEKTTLGSKRLRKLLNGDPIIVVKKGEIVYDALEKERLSVNELTMLMRSKDVFSLADVDYAILEPNGELSILRKPEKDFPTRLDLEVRQGAPAHLPIAVISDGQVIDQALTEIGRAREWLMGELRRLGISRESQVLYAEVLPSGELFLQCYGR